MSGAPLVPTEIKERRGTLNISRVNDSEPVYPTYIELPHPPDYIQTSSGLELWQRNGMQMVNAGLFHESGYEMLARYCQLHESMNEAMVDIRGRGQIVEDSKGVMRRNPSIDIYHAALTLFLNIAREMGFTPASKSKVSASKGKTIGDKNKKKKISLR